jgi:TRAP transporter TAXI family solute receptor
VSLGTTPPKAQILVALGKADLAFSAPTITNFMARGVAMYRKVKQAPKLFKNLRSIVAHDGGYYTLVVFANSSIKTLKDIKGKKLYLAIPGGAANRVLIAMLKGATGYLPGKDYQMSRLHGSAAIQAFQDGQIDMWAAPSVQPNPVVQQFALTRKIRLLGLTKEDLKSKAIKHVLSFPGRKSGLLAPDLFGANQVNTKPVLTLGTTNSLIVNKDVDAKTVYLLTKTMWQHIDEIWEAGQYMRNLLNKKNAFYQLDVPLHVGALKYYREAGFKIPPRLIPPEAK